MAGIEGEVLMFVVVVVVVVVMVSWPEFHVFPPYQRRKSAGFSTHLQEFPPGRVTLTRFARAQSAGRTGPDSTFTAPPPSVPPLS
ncbi:hypothetical protein E2C01_020910 [Portunus trituberculatus]|uniref:Uncharacterized protein n=1 Tax=Portunus trituberculatus TaxID=210409 RepID=A0A5B7E160_PORTR|nr:hypothetical protein [Portunus trituberculatus]